MDKLIISNNKIFFKFWSMDKKKHMIVEITPAGLLDHLWDDVQVNKITLRRIFEIMRPNIRLWGLILNENIEPLFSEMFDKKCKCKNKENLKYLEVYREVEYEHGECMEFHSFHAYGQDTHETGAYYSVGLSPINSIGEIEIKIDTEFKICEAPSGTDSKYKWKFGSKNFTLLEFLKAIFWELCFYGNPEERDKFYNNIIEECNKIKEEELINKI